MGGNEMHALMAELYLLPRSLTGEGVRRTLARLRAELPLEIREVPSGTRVFDWTVPPEWNIRDAYIKDGLGRRLVDFRESNLHVVSYSLPVDRRMPLQELLPQLHTLPEHPDWIPYRTSYYRETWGFCLSQRRLEALEDGEYEVRIDSTLEPGSLTYGELFLEGRSDEDVLISCHCCHPSLANDNLSGIAVAVALARALRDRKTRYGYRFVFAPATIGPIVWMATQPDSAARVRHGLVLACLGDPGASTYKRSRRGDALIDRAAEHVLASSGQPYRIDDFVPYGYDERQYCSPGFDLPVGRLTRTPNGEYPEYHSSADDLSLVTAAALEDSLTKCLAIVDILEHDGCYRNLSPYGEPQLGRRGLYEGLAGRAELPGYEMALLWVLNQSDGSQSLLDIATRARLPFETIRSAAGRLQEAGLLAAVAAPDHQASLNPSGSAGPHREEPLL
jgi:aminopeptidase-like protein